MGTAEEFQSFYILYKPTGSHRFSTLQRKIANLQELSDKIKSDGMDAEVDLSETPEMSEIKRNIRELRQELKDLKAITTQLSVQDLKEEDQLVTQDQIVAQIDVKVDQTKDQVTDEVLSQVMEYVMSLKKAGEELVPGVVAEQLNTLRQVVMETRKEVQKNGETEAHDVEALYKDGEKMKQTMEDENSDLQMFKKYICELAKSNHDYMMDQVSTLHECLGKVEKDLRQDILHEGKVYEEELKRLEKESLDLKTLTACLKEDEIQIQGLEDQFVDTNDSLKIMSDKLETQREWMNKQSDSLQNLKDCQVETDKTIADDQIILGKHGISLDKLDKDVTMLNDMISTQAIKIGNPSPDMQPNATVFMTLENVLMRQREMEKKMAVDMKDVTKTLHNQSHTIHVLTQEGSKDKEMVHSMHKELSAARIPKMKENISSCMEVMLRNEGKIKNQEHAVEQLNSLVGQKSSDAQASGTVFERLADLRDMMDELQPQEAKDLSKLTDRLRKVETREKELTEMVEKMMLGVDKLTQVVEVLNKENAQLRTEMDLMKEDKKEWTQTVETLQKEISAEKRNSESLDKSLRILDSEFKTLPDKVMKYMETTFAPKLAKDLDHQLEVAMEEAADKTLKEIALLRKKVQNVREAMVDEEKRADTIVTSVDANTALLEEDGQEIKKLDWWIEDLYQKLQATRPVPIIPLNPSGVTASDQKTILESMGSPIKGPMIHSPTQKTLGIPRTPPPSVVLEDRDTVELQEVSKKQLDRSPPESPPHHHPKDPHRPKDLDANFSQVEESEDESTRHPGHPPQNQRRSRSRSPTSRRSPQAPQNSPQPLILKRDKENAEPAPGRRRRKSLSRSRIINLGD